MNANHVFRSECIDIEGLFENCNTLDKFLDNLKKQAVNAKTARYVEHGFEALTEAIIRCEKRAMRIQKYSPIPSCNVDLFVHGAGKKSSGKNVAVMACLVKDEDYPLTSNYNHLTTFRANAAVHYKVDVDEPKGFRIFSNAKSVHENTKEQFFSDKSVIFYLKEDIEKMVNGNNKLWMKFKNSLKNIKHNMPTNIVLRPYQSEASKAIYDMPINTKGQVILPTGTGKSLIAIDAIYNEIIRLNGNSPVFLIMTPRIVLTYQLLGETISYLRNKGVDAQYLNLNSGKFDDDSIKEAMAEMGLPVRDVPSTTKASEIEDLYNKALGNGVVFIISATYQSAPRILNTKIPIHMSIHDEAHNLVDGIGRFATSDKIGVMKIKATKELFFTATPAYSDSDEGTGMNNINEYGNIIYRKSPKEMIDAGEIVAPFIHQVIIDEYKIKKNKAIQLNSDNLMDTDVEKNVEFMAMVVEESFAEHCKKVKQYSRSPGKVGGKMLVVCRGDGAFQGFFSSKGFEEMKKANPNVKFLGISSAFGAWIDGEHVEVQGGWYKELFMLALINLKPEDNVVILHIDMLAEGINVPGITGVLPFRDLGTIKSCQTLGRAMRLLVEDRKDLYSGKRLADDKVMDKPYAWVIIPIYSMTHKDMECRVINIARQIRENIGYLPFENAGKHEGCDGRNEVLQKTDYGSLGKRPDEMTLRHIVENPYFEVLTGKAIDDSLNGNDNDFFEVIRKVRTTNGCN